MLRMMAFDLGASNYRAVTGLFNGSKLQVKEQLRHRNTVVQKNGHYRWNTESIFGNLRGAIEEVSSIEGEVSSIAIDSWGADFGLIDEKGVLLGEPIAHRDKLAKESASWFEREITRPELYEITGGSVPSMSTICVLHGLMKKDAKLVSRAKSLLLMPDLISFFFDGEVFNEYTITSTSRLLGAKSRNWDFDLIRRLGFEEELFGDLVQPGFVSGRLKKDLRTISGLQKTQVIRTLSHDTAAAVSTIPLRKGQVYISSGTWSVMGVVLEQPILSNDAMYCEFENEGMPEGKIRFLRNIPGLFMQSECLKSWKEDGLEIDLKALDAKVEQLMPGPSMIYPEYHSFVEYGNMPEKIREFCRTTNQTVPESPAELLATVNKGMAMEYRKTIEDLERITGNAIDSIYIVGGGVNNKPLCQLAANITGKQVTTGFSEASSVGNLLMQAQTHGEISGLVQISDVARASFPVKQYTPEIVPGIDDDFQQYLTLRCNNYQ